MAEKKLIRRVEPFNKYFISCFLDKFWDEPKKGGE